MTDLSSAASTAPASKGDSTSTRKRIASGALLAMTGVVLGALSDWRAHHALLINASQSLPDWAFLVERGRFPSRGDYVAFAPGRDPLVRRHFGEKPPAFVKIAFGVPGDRVDRAGFVVRVNGRTIARLRALAQHASTSVEYTFSQPLMAMSSARFTDNRCHGKPRVDRNPRCLTRMAQGQVPGLVD